MNCLVTGHQGYVGSRLVAELEKLGHHVAGLETEQGEQIDLLDPEAVEARMLEARPQVVFHLGGISGPMLLTDSPRLVLRINGEGTLGMLLAASRAGARRFVYASSIAAFARGPGIGPDSVYGISKRLGEMLAGMGWDRLSLEVTSVRIGSVFGSGRQTANPIHRMVDQALAEGSVPYGSADLEPCIEVRDCVRQLAGLARAAPLRSAYDAVAYAPGGEEVARCIADLTGARPIFQESGQTQRYEISFDAGPLIEDSGSGSPMPLQQALADLVAASRKAGETK